MKSPLDEMRPIGSNQYEGFEIGLPGGLPRLMGQPGDLERALFQTQQPQTPGQSPADPVNRPLAEIPPQIYGKDIRLADRLTPILRPVRFESQGEPIPKVERS